MAYGTCPVCGGPGVIRCRCFVADTECALGHQWHYMGDEMHLGSFPHDGTGNHDNCQRVAPANALALRVVARHLRADDHLDYDAPVNKDDPTGDIASLKRGDQMRFAKLDTFWKKTFGALLLETKKNIDGLVAKTNSDEYKRTGTRLSKLLTSILKTGQDYGELRGEFENKSFWTLDLDEVYGKLMNYEREYEALASKLWASSNCSKKYQEIKRLESFVPGFYIEDNIRDALKEITGKMLPAVSGIGPLPSGAHPPYQLRGAWLGAEVAHVLGQIMREKHRAMMETTPDALRQRKEEEAAEKKQRAELAKNLKAALDAYAKKVERELERVFASDWDKGEVSVWISTYGITGEATVSFALHAGVSFVALELRLKVKDGDSFNDATLKVTSMGEYGVYFEKEFTTKPDPKAIVALLPRELHQTIDWEYKVAIWLDEDSDGLYLVALSEKNLRKKVLALKLKRRMDTLQADLDYYRNQQQSHVLNYERMAQIDYRTWLLDGGDKLPADQQQRREDEFYAEAERKRQEYLSYVDEVLVPQERKRLIAEGKEAVERGFTHIRYMPVGEIPRFTPEQKDALVARLKKAPNDVVTVRAS